MRNQFFWNISPEKLMKEINAFMLFKNSTYHYHVFHRQQSTNHLLDVFHTTAISLTTTATMLAFQIESNPFNTIRH